MCTRLTHFSCQFPESSGAVFSDQHVPQLGEALRRCFLAKGDLKGPHGLNGSLSASLKGKKVELDVKAPYLN